ncbi:hypothetical protein BK011_10375 [Tenericutes bacterium MZ-XQ]|jgi:hypothetical protein|nr:hypothetical protein BK011_10375 [Tenericutes bacterium MZ-XQ]
MPSWIEWVGYVASLIVLISLVMSSVKRLRWINLSGSLIFAVYGILISSYPVAAMNLGIVLVNSYYLYQIYSKKDLFELIPVQDDAYFEHFIDVYKKDMSEYIHLSHDIKQTGLLKFFVYRNTVPAGLFIGRAIDEDKLDIWVDYTTPMYRDFKIAEYIYTKKKQVFLDKGFKMLYTKPGQEKHNKYLEKIGFTLTEFKNEPYYSKEI